MRLAAVSVDLDEIPCYTAIHGLPSPRDDRAHAIYDRALPRFAELFEEEGVHATFFAIGRDLTRRDNADAVRALSRSGHEIGNHSYSHFYDLTRKHRAEITDEIRRGGNAIERATGRHPVGFRAPGYTITDDVFDLLEAEGYLYDSSVFPCPTYFGAKASAMALIRMRGRTSKSVLDDPRVLTAPADPYRVGVPYYERGHGMLEIPIGVTRDETMRLPYIGTSVVLAGASGARVLTRLIAGRPVVSLELHGMDLADADADEIGFLARHQPDLRRPLAEKREALVAAIRTLRDAGYRFVTLEGVASAVMA